MAADWIFFVNYNCSNCCQQR